MFGNDNEATLNSLIATTLDSADGYRKAAEKADSERYRSLFLEYAGEREKCVRQLQDAVRAIGGTPEDDGTVLASAHRAFLSLRDSLTGGGDDTGIVNEVERGEDHIKAKFEAAMKDDKLSGEADRVVRDVYQSVKQGHDRMRDLKHSLQGVDHATSTSGGTDYASSGTAGTGTNTGIAAGTGTGAAFGSSTTGFDEPQSGYGAAPGTATSGGAMTGGSGSSGSGY